MTVDEYLEGVPEPHRGTLSALRETLRSIMPDATETISYGIPAFKLNGKAIAGYAAFKNHCSYFPHSGSVLPAVSGALGSYDWEGGTLRFPPGEPLSPALVNRLVATRLRQLGFDQSD